MTARKLFTTLTLAALVLPAVDADGKRKRKPKLVGDVSGCVQKHRGTVDRIILEARARAVRPSGRAVAATFQQITWTFKMTGPYVSKGTATSRSNAQGVTHALFEITGPGEYVVDWTASRAGAKPDSGTEKVTITGPVTAPCAHEAVL